MRFEAAGTYVNGVADIDPEAAPATAITTHILGLRRRQPDSDIEGRRILLALDAPSGETLTLELWALDDATDPPPDTDSPNLAGRRWYRFATAVVATGARIVEVTAIIPPGGTVYARRTADTLTAPRRLLASCVP